MLYEYRRYEAAAGRVGDVMKRFRDSAAPAWERHGVRLSGMWQPVIGDNAFVHYMVEWESLAEREAVWSAFQADPEWKNAKHASEQDGPLLLNAHNEIWKPVDFRLPGRAES